MRQIALSSNFVKLFALVTMLADHQDKIILKCSLISDTIGRTAFPLFSFLIISNFYTFHPFKKYVLRLGLFGILTSLILHFFDPNFNNVLFTFLWAIIYIQSCEYICGKTKSLFWQGYWLGLLFLILLPFILMADYSLPGFFFLLSLYAYHRFPSKQNYVAVLFTGLVMNCSSLTAALSTLFILIFLLSGCRIRLEKRWFPWWVFYVYYPLHLVLLHLLKGVF